MAGELRAYIWYYCCLALPAREEALRRDLGKFLRTGEFFGTREPENVRNAIAGYSTRAESIWVRPYRLNEHLLAGAPKGEPGRFLYPGDGIAADLASFIDTREFAAWRDQDRSRSLANGEMATMRAIMGESAPRRLAYRGVVLFGSAAERKVTWLGTRENPTYASLTSAQISKRLRYPPSFIAPAIGSTSTRELPGTAAGLSVLTSQKFDDLARDLVRTTPCRTLNARSYTSTETRMPSKQRCEPN